MATRYNINDFALANPAYVGGTVSFWTVSGGAKTATLATLYAASTGSTTLANPRTLDSDGKFSVPVYVEVPTIATVSGLTIADHDTGIMGLAEGAASTSAAAAVVSAAAALASQAAAAVSADAALVSENNAAATLAGAAASGANTDITSLAGIALTQNVALSGDISPTQITANQNDYNPTGLSTASVLRLNTDASRDITGLQGGADGRLIVIHNVGSFSIVLKDESGSSTAANRFALFADITLATDQSVVLQYDSTSSRWRAVALPAGTAGAAGDVQTFNAGGTWTKPASGTMALIEVWGAGGGGARRSAGNGSGGGGGGYTFMWKKLSDLGATETVTIGAGGAVQNTDNTNGNNGGNTSFGSWALVYGGTAGMQAASLTAAFGGGPGGIFDIRTAGGSTQSVSDVFGTSGALTTNTAIGAFGSSAGCYVNAFDAIQTMGTCFMGGSGGGSHATVSATQSVAGVTVNGGTGGNGNRTGAGGTGAQPGGGGGSGTAGGGAGGDGRVKVSVF